MKSINFGIFGLGRGGAFYDIVRSLGGNIVAVCDRNEQRMKNAVAHLGSKTAAYADFDAFIEHDGLDAVFLCNNFHEHAPFAIRALEKNIHVLSECTSNGTMADGVRLVRAAEKSKAIYMLAENYPFIKFNLEMRRVYRGGSLGKALYAEGEYNHPLDPFGNAEIKHLRPYREHWRNRLPRSYYITHSLAPLMYMTGAFPKRVTAMPVCHPFPEESLLFAGSADRAAIVTTLNDDGSVFRVTGCAAFGAHEISYRICGDKGQIESSRAAGNKVLLTYNPWDVPKGAEVQQLYEPDWNDADEEKINAAGHGGGDYLVIREFFSCIRENKRPVFDEYFATAMASVAILSHRSILEGSVPYDIPDFKLEADRVKYENDELSPFYGTDGTEPSLPSGSIDTVMTPEQIERYEKLLSEC